MRRTRASTGVRTSNLDGDDRFAALAGFFQSRDKSGAIADRFTEQHHNMGLRIFDDIIEEVGHGEVGFIAGGDDVAEAKVSRFAPIEQRETDTTGLGDDTNTVLRDKNLDVIGLRFDGGAEGPIASSVRR